MLALALKPMIALAHESWLVSRRAGSDRDKSSELFRTPTRNSSHRSDDSTSIARKRTPRSRNAELEQLLGRALVAPRLLDPAGASREAAHQNARNVAAVRASDRSPAIAGENVVAP